jgi:hypothetical protein
MTAEEKVAYDIANPPLNTSLPKNKSQILTEIWMTFYPPSGATPEETQERYYREERMLGALNANPIWMQFLEDRSWDTARWYMLSVLEAGAITLEDYDIINSILPSGSI